MFNKEMSKNIAEIFKATRKFNGLQQSEFSTVLGVTQGTISKIEAANMCPELGLWFKFLKSFDVVDPYCFTYGGVEYHENSFKKLTTEGSSFMSFSKDNRANNISTVREIRPMFDFLLKNNFRSVESFLKDNKIKMELFTILNHPLDLGFIDMFFSFLAENKINERSISRLNLNFDCALGRWKDDFNPALKVQYFFSGAGKENEPFVTYRENADNKSYNVSISKKNQHLLETMNSKDLFLSYNLLYPYHYAKAMNNIKVAPPSILKQSNNKEWCVTYTL